MPATTILSNNPVNSVFSNDNSHFTYRHIDFSKQKQLRHHHACPCLTKRSRFVGLFEIANFMGVITLKQAS